MLPAKTSGRARVHGQWRSRTGVSKRHLHPRHHQYQLAGSPFSVRHLLFRLHICSSWNGSSHSDAAFYNVGRYEKNEGKPKATFLPTKLTFFTLLAGPRGLEFTLAFFLSDFSGELPSRWADVTPPPRRQRQAATTTSAPRLELNKL